LARALYGDPVLVVLDEPNSNLDDAGEKALGDAVRDLSQRGKTSVLITHRPSALAVASKLMVLRDGTIAAFGPREEVLAALNGRPVAPQGAPAPMPAVVQAPAMAPNNPVAARSAPPVLTSMVPPAAPRAAPPAPPAAKAPAAKAPEPKPGMPPFDLKFAE
jgi:ATP-binding cassette subfamily C exporter for protease/lipase